MTINVDFSLRQLQYAVAVADTLSFRRAAERCHVSQPSLSVQLQRLEEALEVQLFERTRRRVLLTPAGRELVERARRILLEVDDFQTAARQTADPLQGTLRIGVIPTISPYLLPMATPILRTAYPQMRTVWIEDKTPVLVRELGAGTIDAALLALEAELGDVDHALVGIDPFLLATRRDDPLGMRTEPAKPSELRTRDVLLLDDGHCLRDQVLSYCSKAKARELEFRATSLSTLAHMVAGGAGVTLLPRIAVPTEAHRANLCVREFAKPRPYRTLVLAWRHRSPVGDALKQVAETLKQCFPA